MAVNTHDEYVTGLGSTANRLRDEVQRQQMLIDSYRLLVPRLIAQADNERRQAQGLSLRPVDCTNMHPTRELVCLRPGGHDGAHTHNTGTLAVSWG